LNTKKEGAPKEKVPALVSIGNGQVKILAWKTSHSKFSTDRMLDEAILKQAFNGSTSFYKSDSYF
jgi:hypothetical protein